MKKEKQTLGTRIGKGREAETYILNKNHVVKLFFNKTAERVKIEFWNNVLIYESGLSVPAAIRRYETNGRLGIVFDRIHGKSMLTEMSIKPWKLFRYAKQLAEFHSNMHNKSILGLPKQRTQLIKKIQSVKTVSETTKLLAIDFINSMQNGQQLCHGDYHPDNVMMTETNFKIIDWSTASSGNPIADFALTSIILQMGELPPGTPLITKWIVTNGRKLFHHFYQSQYFKLNPNSKSEYEKWLLPIAIGRLSEGIAEEQNKLLSFIKVSEKDLSKWELN